MKLTRRRISLNSSILAKIGFYAYASAMFMVIASPTSRVLNIDLRNILFGLNIGLIFLIANDLYIGRRQITLAIFSFLFLAFYSLVAIIYGVDIGHTKGEFSQFLVTLIIIVLYFINRSSFHVGIISRLTVSYTLYGVVCYGAVKLCINILALCGILDVAGAYKVLFGLEIEPWEFYVGLYRVYFINDLIAILIFFLAAAYVKMGNFLKYMLIVSVTSILILNFSRLLIAVALILVLTVMLSKKMKFGIYMLVPLVFTYWIFKFEPAMDLFKLRFVDLVGASDAIRSEQYAGLFSAFEASPFAGTGLGSYLPNLIRADESVAYLYEMQWMSFLMKFGLLGAVILLLVFLTPFYFIYCKKNILTKMQYFTGLFCYAVFIVSGLTNPYLISAVSGLYIVFIFSILDNSGDVRDAWIKS